MLAKFLKIIFAVLLVSFFVYTDQVNFAKLALYILTPYLMLFLFILFFLIVVPLMTLRLWLVLNALQVNINLKKVWGFVWIGNFFNTILPGSVSGDFVKFYYIKKENDQLSKTKILSLLLYDRIIGLTALISLSFIGVIFEKITTNHIEPYLAYFIYLLFFCMMIFFIFNFINFNKILKMKKMKKLLEKKLFDSLFQFATLLNHQKKTLLLMFFISLIMQSFVILFIIYVSSFFDQNQLILEQFIIIPIGLIIVALPLTPAGIGTGHASFAGLYALFGNIHGGDIFNIFVIGQIFIFLFGAFPFILKKDIKIRKKIEDMLDKEKK